MVSNRHPCLINSYIKQLFLLMGLIKAFRLSTEDSSMTEMVDISDIKPGVSGNKFLNNRQTLFIGYTLLVLIDLVVLGLFSEYWHYVVIDSFTLMLLTACLLQLLLKFTLKIEHRVAEFFNSKPGVGAKVMRWLSAWAIIFLSKFPILAIIDLKFGEHVEFGGILPFIGVAFSIIVAELIITKIYYMLADE